MHIKQLSYSTETYIWYNVQRGKQVKTYMWVIYHELVLFLQSRNYFHYVPENEIKEDILGWTISLVMLHGTTQAVFHFYAIFYLFS